MVRDDECMPRGPRRIKPGLLQFITMQCFQGRYLLRPSGELNLLFIGVLAMAQVMFPEVRVCIVSALSNHYHALIWAPTGDHIASFMNFVNSCIAREAGRLHGWEGRFWHARYSNENIVDEEGEIDRLEYALAQGCKEGLVPDPRKWPGPNCAKALTTGKMTLRGIWIDRTAMSRAQAQENRKEPARRKKIVEKDFAREVELKLSPIPAWADLTVKQYARKCRQLVRRIVRAARGKFTRFVGVKKILSRDPQHRPEKRTSGKEPPVFGGTEEHRLHYINEHRFWVAQYRAASNGRREAQGDIRDYPPHCFLPGGYYYAG